MAGEQAGPATGLEVEIKEPVVRHVVTLQQIKRWGCRNGGESGGATSAKRRVSSDWGVNNG
jgi:hypothetical protein